MPIVRVAMIPSLLTLGNFTCGFVAIVMTLHAVRDHTAARILESTHAEYRALEDARRDKAHADATRLSEKLSYSGVPPGPVTVSSSSLSLASLGVDTVRADTPDIRADHRIRFLRHRSNDLFIYACLLIFLGMVFDTLDGRVARMTGSDSKFGAELDSLADASTFGLAPAALVTALWVFAMPDGKSWWGQVMIFAAGYAACAALRLARYNVETGSLDRNYFHGLPSPGAAGCVASTALLLRHEDAFAGLWNTLSECTEGRFAPDDVQVRVLAGYTLLIGYLMVTRLTFIHVPNKYLSGRRKFTSLVLCVFLVVPLVMEPWKMLCLGFNGYVVWCLLHHAWRRCRRRAGREAIVLATLPDGPADENAPSPPAVAP